MNYLLTILTNGRHAYFERAVHAFAQHANPAPDAVFVMDDGGQTGRELVAETIHAAFGARAHRAKGHYEDSPVPLGMCRAHAHCWHAAAASDLPWVFHLEDDFVLLRPLELDHLRATLEAEPTVAQMALVRTPWGFEVPHGGYIPQTPGHYERRETGGYEIEVCGRCSGQVGDDLFCDDCRAFAADPKTVTVGASHWVATRRNWATNPALFPTSLARRYPWPLENGCETSIGPAILEAEPDAVFGLWGWGEPWAAHIGEARQPGAHGY